MTLLIQTSASHHGAKRRSHQGLVPYRFKALCTSGVSWRTIDLSPQVSQLKRRDFGKKAVILPAPINLEVGFGQPFFVKTDALQQVDRRLIVGKAGCFNAVHTKLSEQKGEHGGQDFAHIAFAGMSLTHPITQTARLADAIANIRDGQTTQKVHAILVKHKERIALLVAGILRVAA